jgi:hypothetical protein
LIDFSGSATFIRERKLQPGAYLQLPEDLSRSATFILKSNPEELIVDGWQAGELIRFVFAASDTIR